MHHFSRLKACLIFSMSTQCAMQRCSATKKPLKRPTAQRVGSHKIAESAMKRATAFYDAGQFASAVNELHKASVNFLSKERARAAVLVSIHLAELYGRLGLYAAQKFYGLSAAYAALHIKDDTLPELAAYALRTAASADYAQGASFLYALSQRICSFVASEYGWYKDNDKCESELFFYSMLTMFTAEKISQDLGNVFREKLNMGAEIEAEREVRKTFIERYGTLREISALAQKQHLSAPLTDLGGIRKVGWRQLAIDWTVEWEPTFYTTAQAEAFVAMLQIVLLDLNNEELSLGVSAVYCRIESHDGGYEVSSVPDNDRFSVLIKLSREADPTLNVLSFVMWVLANSSAMPNSEFMTIFERHFVQGLGHKIHPYVPYSTLFQEFYPLDEFDKLYSCASKYQPHSHFGHPEPVKELAGDPGLHPNYNQQESFKAIGNRYYRSLKFLKYSLPRLAKEGKFLDTVATLREEGWKDWHILLALVNIRFNHVIHSTIGAHAPIEQFKATHSLLNKRDEEADDPLVPLEKCTVKRMHESLEMSKASTLIGYELELHQRTPNLDGLDKLLSRFNYWTDDVSHPDPFEPRQ
jgi:hypothetical protein